MTLGYDLTDGIWPEAGYERVVFYMSSDRVTHLARELPDGRWTSKLGESWDIAHDDPGALTGSDYGEPAFAMRRPR